MNFEVNRDGENNNPPSLIPTRDEQNASKEFIQNINREDIHEILRRANTSIDAPVKVNSPNSSE